MQAHVATPRQRSTARTVSWLTRNSAASSRRVRFGARHRIASRSSGDSLRGRGRWYGERPEEPADRRLGGSAMTIAPGGNGVSDGATPVASAAASGSAPSRCVTA